MGGGVFYLVWILILAILWGFRSAGRGASRPS